jgi:hypothetical protein
MAKDRNTFAKRQREMERKRKADEKRLHRVKKKQEAAHPSGPDRAPATAPQPESSADSPAMLSPSQLAVLTIFRRFRITPGQMLCFSRSDVEALGTPLAELADQGLLLTERFSGGYSLTPPGFAAMQTIA